MNPDPLVIDQPFFIELLKSLLEPGTPARFTAQGFSMSPLIKSGDVLTVAPLIGNVIAVGTIVAYLRSHNNTLVVHRVIARRGDKYLLKGDNLLAPDGWIARQDMLGEVVRIERGLRIVSFGLGNEKRLLAWLSRARVFPVVFMPHRFIRGCFCRKKQVLPAQALEQKPQQQPPDEACFGQEKGKVHQVVDKKDADRA